MSALQVAGINPSESRSCDYTAPPCIYAFRTTLYFYSYITSSIHLMIMMMVRITVKIDTKIAHDKPIPHAKENS